MKALEEQMGDPAAVAEHRFCVCPRCGGRFTESRCNDCGGFGIVRSAPPDSYKPICSPPFRGVCEMNEELQRVSARWIQLTYCSQIEASQNPGWLLSTDTATPVARKMEPGE